MVKVLVNTHDRRGNVTGRKEVNAEMIEERTHSVLVKLPGGKVVVRKKSRDLADVQ